MKKLMKVFAVACLSAMTLTACSNDSGSGTPDTPNDSVPQVLMQSRLVCTMN